MKNLHKVSRSRTLIKHPASTCQTAVCNLVLGRSTAHKQLISYSKLLPHEGDSNLQEALVGQLQKGAKLEYATSRPFPGHHSPN